MLTYKGRDITNHYANCHRPVRLNKQYKFSWKLSSNLDTTSGGRLSNKYQTEQITRPVNVTFDVDILNCKSQNYGPDHAQSHLQVTIDDFWKQHQQP